MEVSDTCGSSYRDGCMHHVDVPRTEVVTRNNAVWTQELRRVHEILSHALNAMVAVDEDQ